MDTNELLILCKRHFGNQGFRIVSECGIGTPIAALEALRPQNLEDVRSLRLGLLVPGLAVVGGGPDFAL